VYAGIAFVAVALMAVISMRGFAPARTQGAR
jgi:hypothetical protein